MERKRNNNFAREQLILTKESTQLNKLIKIFISILLIALVHLNSFIWAKELPTRNIDVFDSLLYSYANDIAGFISQNNFKSIDIIMNSHQAENFLKRNLVQALAEKSIEVYQFNANSKNSILLVLDVKEITIVYEAHNDGKKIIRKFNVAIAGYFKDENEKLTIIPDFNKSYTDLIIRDKIDYVENSPFDFAKSQIPEKPEGLFKKIIEPTIIIGSALITLILLFTIRSN